MPIMVELKSVVGQIKDVTLGTESLAESGELSSIHVSACGGGCMCLCVGVGACVYVWGVGACVDGWVRCGCVGVWVHVWVGGWVHEVICGVCA